MDLGQEALSGRPAGHGRAAEEAPPALRSQVPVENEEEQQPDEEPPRPAAGQQAREPLQSLLQPHGVQMAGAQLGVSVRRRHPEMLGCHIELGSKHVDPMDSVVAPQDEGWLWLM